MSRNNHNTQCGSTIERSDDRINITAEVFTPMNLCVQMVSEISLEELQNPQSTFLDPAAGNGNFMIALKQRLIEYHAEDHVLNHMLYAVELMEDNHKEMCERLGVSTDHQHYVCADALAYDYSFGEPVGLEAFM
jgi:hypothetical protein